MGGGPSELHDARRDQGDFVEPFAAGDTLGGPDRLEHGSVVPDREPVLRDLPVSGGVQSVEHDIDVGRFGRDSFGTHLWR